MRFPNGSATEPRTQGAVGRDTGARVGYEADRFLWLRLSPASGGCGVYPPARRQECRRCRPGGPLHGYGPRVVAGYNSPQEVLMDSNHSAVSRRSFISKTTGVAAAGAFTIVKPESVRGSQANSKISVGPDRRGRPRHLRRQHRARRPPRADCGGVRPVRRPR